MCSALKTCTDFLSYKYYASAPTSPTAAPAYAGKTGCIAYAKLLWFAPRRNRFIFHGSDLMRSLYNNELRPPLDPRCGNVFWVDWVSAGFGKTFSTRMVKLMGLDFNLREGSCMRSMPHAELGCPLHNWHGAPWRKGKMVAVHISMDKGDFWRSTFPWAVSTGRTARKCHDKSTPLHVSDRMEAPKFLAKRLPTAESSAALHQITGGSPRNAWKYFAQWHFRYRWVDHARDLEIFWAFSDLVSLDVW